MTIDEFMQELSRLGDGWYLMSQGALRRLTTPYNLTECPITAVLFAKRALKVGPPNYAYAGQLLGLSEQWTRILVDSADNRIEPQSDFNPGIRVRLLEACGVKP
jgi:hypothetical protein